MKIRGKTASFPFRNCLCNRVDGIDLAGG